MREARGVASDHKVLQAWPETDRLGAPQQLGLVPDTLGRPPGPSHR